MTTYFVSCAYTQEGGWFFDNYSIPCEAITDIDIIKTLEDNIKYRLNLEYGNNTVYQVVILNWKKFEEENE